MIEQNERKNIISVITNPLGFFALSLLIVEGFLGIVLIFSKSLENPYFWGMVIGAILFFLVVIGAWLLVWFKPRNLTFGGRDYIERDKNITAQNINSNVPTESSGVIIKKFTKYDS